MARCQKYIRIGGGGVVQCKNEAAYLCVLPMTYTQFGRAGDRTEYRCEEHKKGKAWRLRGAR